MCKSLLVLHCNFLSHSIARQQMVIWPNTVTHGLLHWCTQTVPISVTNLPRSGGTVFIIPDGRTVDNTWWSDILVENSDFFIPHLHLTPPIGGSPRRNIAILFDVEKLKWHGYRTVKKSMRTRLLLLTQYMNVTNKVRIDRHCATA